MKKKIIPALILCILSALTMLFQVFALNDIAHDYVSQKALAQANLGEAGKTLPAWTECRLEWNMVRVDFVIRLLFILAAGGVLIRLFRGEKQGQV